MIQLLGVTAQGVKVVKLDEIPFKVSFPLSLSELSTGEFLIENKRTGYSFGRVSKDQLTMIHPSPGMDSVVYKPLSKVIGVKQSESDSASVQVFVVPDIDAEDPPTLYVHKGALPEDEVNANQEYCLRLMKAKDTSSITEMFKQ